MVKVNLGPASEAASGSESTLLDGLKRLGTLPPPINPSVHAISESRFRLLDDEAMRHAPSIPPLVDQFIPQRSLAVIYGEPGSGKSFLVLDLACSIATGIPWHGREVQRGPVVYVAAEGTGGMPSRLAAWKEAHEADGVLGVYFLPEPVRLVERDDAKDLLALLKALPEPPVLVIFDTLARSMAGADENSGRDMGVLIEVADEIRLQVGCTVLFVHHPTKGDKRDERGSGQLRGAADMMAVVVKNKSTLTVECEKPKDYSPFSPMRFQLIPYLDSCVVAPLESSTAHGHDTPNDDTLSRQERTAVTVLVRSGEPRLSSSEWEARCATQHLPGSTYFDVAKKLVDRGLVAKSAEGRRVWYSATDAGRAVVADNSNGPTA